MTTNRPLHYRVLNVGRGIAPAYTTRLLADLGASASWWRWSDPRPGDWPDSTLFRAWFEDSVELVDQPCALDDLLARLETVAASFDLIVTDFNAREVAEDALYERLRPYNPRIVIANADHFGRHGPYAEWAGDELTDYAMGGYWSLAGDPGEAPLRVPGYQAQFHAGMQLALGALAALRHASHTGQGQEVEVTGAEAMLGAHWSTTVAWTHEGRILERAGSDLFPAADGWVFFYRLGLYPNLFILIEQPELMEDERWSTIPNWLANAEELWQMVADWCTTKPVAEIVQTAQELRIPVTPMDTAETLLSDEGLAGRDFFRQVEGKPLPGKPYHWSEPCERAPAHTMLADALAQGEATPNASPQPTTTPAVVSSPGPLAGVRILELTNNWAGPIAGRHLGDLGAEVIKVELAAKSATRLSHYPGKTPGKYHWNRSGYFNEMNRNKRDLSLNLASDRGRELFLDLVREADVVVENNSARVMPNLGLGYDALREANPRIIMASISGFGATGPRRDWVAFGSNIEAASGLAAITGYPGDVPYRTGTFVADPIAGGHAVIGILAALERRERTGDGVHLDIALTESAMPFMLEAFAYYHEHGTLMPRRGNAEPGSAPAGAYRCADGDEWITVAVRTDDQWRALCALAGWDDLAGLGTAERIARRDEIDARLAEWTATCSQFECVRQLQGAGVPAARILHNWQLHADPHLVARDAFIPIEHPDTGVYPYPGFPWHFSAIRPVVRMAAPRFAEANRYVFGRLLGLDDAAIEQLYESGVTADEPTGLTPVVV